MGFFRNFLGALFRTTENGEVIEVNSYVPDKEQLGLMVDIYALHTAVETKANLLANCEYKTYRNGKETRGPMWALLNYKPNDNQSATQFWAEFYCKLFYYGEVLVFPYHDQYIIADSFQREDYAIKEQLFHGITRGDFTYNRSFLMSEVIYVREQNNAARALKTGLLNRINTLTASTVENLEKSGGEKVFLNVPANANGDKSFADKYNDLMNNRFKSFFSRKNAVLPLTNGMQAAFHKSENGSAEVDNIKKLLNTALTQAALAHGLSPALLTGEVAGIKEAMDWTLTIGIDPPANAVSEELTTKLWKREEICGGNFIAADTSNIKHIDIFDIASAVDKLISSGFLSIDEGRSAAGLQRIGSDWSKKHYLTKNYQAIDKLEELSGNTN